MTLNSLNSLDINKLHPQDTLCDCGATHSFNTQRVSLYSGAIEELEELMVDILPPLSKVLIISDDKNVDSGIVRQAEKILIKQKYRVSLYTFDTDLLGTTAEADLVEVGETTKFIIGIGGSEICDITKYVSAKENLESAFIITCPTACVRSLAPSALLDFGELEEIFKTPVFKFMLCDTYFLKVETDTKLAGAFGELFSKFIALLDYNVAHFVAKEPFCKEILRQGFLILDDGLKLLERKGKMDSVEIANIALKFSALTQLSGNSRLFSGGESQSAHALRILLAREERKILNRGEAEFILARALACIYQRFLGTRTRFFTPPPDNNMRLERIEEFLGIDEKSAIKKIRPVLEAKKGEIQSYRLNENREELFSVASLNATRFKKSLKIFKGIYEDDGFWLGTALDSSDTALSISLGPDLKDKFTLLSHMKDMGLLDEYIKELI